MNYVMVYIYMCINGGIYNDYWANHSDLTVTSLES